MRKILGRTIHIDACYLLALEEDDTRDFIRDQLNEAIYRRDRKGEVIRVSIVALGECLMRCLENPRYRIENIFGWLDRLRVDTPAPDREVMRIANELMDLDYEMKPCDALIVAIALHDQSSYILLTTNPPLIGNRAINRKMKELGRNLKITDRFR